MINAQCQYIKGVAEANKRVLIWICTKNKQNMVKNNPCIIKTNILDGYFFTLIFLLFALLSKKPNNYNSSLYSLANSFIHCKVMYNIGRAKTKFGICLN